MSEVKLLDEERVQDLSRRAFMRGASLLLGFALAKPVYAMVRESDLGRDGALDAKATGFDGFVPDGFIRIGADGHIVLVIPSAEMGQGIATTEAMLIAEELEVGLDQIEVALAPADPLAYNQAILKGQVTGGSTSVRAFYTPLRKSGATARVMLVRAAALQWGVDEATCTAARGSVFHAKSGRNAPYGSLVGLARSQPVPTDVPLKQPSAFKLIGQPVKRLDTPEKAKGEAKFGIDASVDGMKYAAVSICPTIGGFVKSLNATATRAVPGVVDVLQIDDAVAVVAANYWIARKGIDLLEIGWDDGPNTNLSTETLFDDLKNASGTPIVGKLVGDPEAAFAKYDRVEAVYRLPYLAHAALEPINTTIHVRPDGCDVWVSTQVPEIARVVVSEIVGLPHEKVTVHPHLIGGGFGRRLAVDTIQQAARFAKMVDYPIKIIWSREQDIMHDRFRPGYYDRVSAAIGPDGLPAAFSHKVTSSTVRPYYDRKPWPENQLDPDALVGSNSMPYSISAGRWEWLRHDSPVALNWWRGVGEGHNVFVVENFIDELAARAGQDPISYRLQMLSGNPRAAAVLRRVMEPSGWGTALPTHCGRGVSLHQAFGSFAALVIEVEVDSQGDITLRRATAAVDCGVPINPDNIVAQIQGGTLFGLSAALYNGITIASGKVLQSNFHDYRQIRMNEVPPFEVAIMPSTESPGGLGEVGTVSAPAALTNAIFAATGVRLRSLPVDRSLLISDPKTKTSARW